jgi:hypothetical protein
MIVASAFCTFERIEGEKWNGSYDLYRTEGGAFLLVSIDMPVDPTPWGYDEPWYMQRVDFRRLSYDKALQFVRGEGTWNGLHVELLEEGVFPKIEEPVDEEDGR